jgi:murein DD-endopeptidase MepM/ murein hydrolase activator NlpD
VAKAAPQTRCFVCGRSGADADWFVLLEGRARRLHCSYSCLSTSATRRRRLVARRRLRGLLALMVLALAAAGAQKFRQHLAPPSEWISGGPAEPLKEPPPPGPIPYGPTWPPTDEEWTILIESGHWTYPLPGPARRALTPDARIFGPAEAATHKARCRTTGHCAVDLGGDLWGEHVYAAQDGVVERVQGPGHADHSGQYVRISHLGGLVFTQYFHLAAIPRGIARGAHVKAGQLIGLLGDTGTEDGRRHLCFALSVRPSVDYPEVFWDPSPWMHQWPLRVPPNGSVAGFVLSAKPGDMPRRGHL